MNYEEEITKLTAKISTMASMQIVTEMKLDRLIELQSETEKRLQGLIDTVERIDEGMSKAANILLNHHARLDDLEGNRPQ